ncbi:hypothetical protein ACEPPN_008317 [Leptodophora sp. 'Broadleaf-Isolate-01']
MSSFLTDFQICNRCVRFGIACDGYDRQSRTPSPRARSQGSTMVQRTRTPSLPSISHASTTPIFGGDDEALYFNVFRDQTAFQITPFFDSDPFRIFILQACSVPSIRHVVIAIGALAKSCITFHEQKSAVPGYFKIDHRTHHRAAIQQYSKALGLMREACSQGRQDLRTTLITSLLIACFEGVHGNYTLADAQIESGLTLIENWRKSHPSAGYHPSSFPPPAPDVVDDILIRIFGGLEIQSNMFGCKNTAEQHRTIMYEGEEIVQSMPACFEDYDTARQYLDLIIRRLVHWMHSIDLLQNPEIEDEAQANSNIHFEEVYVGEDFLYGLNPDSVMHSSNFQFEYIHCRSQLDRWNSSFEFLLQQSPFLEGDLAATVLRLGFKACILLLNTVARHANFSLEDDRMNMADIVYLSKAVVDCLRARSNSHFTVLLGTIDPSRLTELFEQPTRSSRIEAVDLLMRWPRREGISDSLFMGQTMRCSQATELNEPGTSNSTPPTGVGGMEATLGEDLKAMKIAYQTLLTPDGHGNRERRRTVV